MRANALKLFQLCGPLPAADDRMLGSTPPPRQRLSHPPPPLHSGLSPPGDDTCLCNISRHDGEHARVPWVLVESLPRGSWHGGGAGQGPEQGGSGDGG